MKFDEYVTLAQRTASTKTNTDKIGHGCLGLIGEAGEVVDIIKKMKYMGMPEEMARNKLIDECSDICWYIAEWCTGSGNSMQEIFDAAAGFYDKFSLETCAVNMVGDAYYLWYDSNGGYTCGNDIRHIATGIKAICHRIDVTLDEVLEHNINKLKKRYPEGFSVDRSNVRYEHG